MKNYSGDFGGKESDATEDAEVTIAEKNKTSDTQRMEYVHVCSVCV